MELDLDLEDGNILASNWQDTLNTVKADAKGSKEEIYSSKVKYFVKKGTPYVWVPEHDLHNVVPLNSKHPSIQPSTTSVSKAADQTFVDLNDDPDEDQPTREPPMGRDAAKRKSRSGSQSSVNNKSSRSEELLHEFVGLRSTLNNLAEQDPDVQRMEDMKFLISDTSHLSGITLDVVLAEKTRIAAKYA
ncbi:hypothetical protein LXL04_009709 [Taraxacum kok-saghyz]